METILFIIYAYYAIRLASGVTKRNSLKKKAYHLGRALLWPVRLVMRLENKVREALARQVM